MNLSAWLSYLETLHPTEIDLGLDRLNLVASELGLNLSSKSVISIGGTNGKGSTSCFLANLLQVAGKSVGLYSSPHILKYNERISINGIPVEDAVLCQAFSRIEEARRQISLTYFEFGTLAALLIFAESEVDYLVLEVGLGGRLDAVNIVDADLAIITNIALDHTEWLGDTREKIAFEKAGIIRQGCPVIFGENDMPQSLKAQISLKQAVLYQSGKDFNAYIADAHWCWQGQNNNKEQCSYKIKLPLASLLNFFPVNAAMALQALLLLDILPSGALLEQALKQAVLSGRFQILERTYTLVLDVAHNPHAVAYLCENMRHYFPKQKIHILIGMLSDKDCGNVLNTLEKIASSWYLASLENSRGSKANMLYNKLQKSAQGKAVMFDSVQEAFHEAEKNIQANDVLLVTGSFYTVADVLELI
jgi:dihydrofolate synthase/folylpolyglutamate synthase